MFKKILAALLILSLLAIGFCACADDKKDPSADPVDSSVEQPEDTSDDSTNDNADTDDGTGDKETVKEPEGTASPNPDEDGMWTPNYVPKS